VNLVSNEQLKAWLRIPDEETLREWLDRHGVTYWNDAQGGAVTTLGKIEAELSEEVTFG